MAAVTPLTGNNWTSPFERPEQPVPAGERPPEVGWQLASNGYFKALQIPVVAGRLFDERDAGANAPPVVIVSEAIQKRFFPNESAVGKRVKLQAIRRPRSSALSATFVGQGSATSRARTCTSRSSATSRGRSRCSCGRRRIPRSRCRRSRQRSSDSSLTRSSSRSPDAVARGQRVGARHSGGAVAPRRVRGDVARAGGDRDLRRHVVRGAAAHARDRDADRARRDAREHPLARAAAGRGDRGGRYGGRSRDGTGERRAFCRRSCTA